MSIAPDLRVDLNIEDDTGLPWALLRDARDPSIVREGAWLVVGSGEVRPVAQVAQVDGDLVWVRPMPAIDVGAVVVAGSERYWSVVRIDQIDDDGQVHFVGLAVDDPAATALLSPSV